MWSGSANFDIKSLKTARPFESANFHGLNRKDLKSKIILIFSLAVLFLPFAQNDPSPDAEAAKMNLLLFRCLELPTTLVHKQWLDVAPEVS